MNWKDPVTGEVHAIPSGMQLVPMLPSDSMIAQGARLGFTEQQTCELYCEMLNAYAFENSGACKSTVACRSCTNGRFIVECCSGANGCDCRGQPVDMGPCKVCRGTGFHDSDADRRANIRSHADRTFSVVPTDLIDEVLP